MPFPSLALDQHTPPSDEHINPPPAAYIPQNNPSSPASVDHLGAPPTRLVANTDPQCQSIQRDEVLIQLGTREHRPGDLEARQPEGFPWRAIEGSTACVFCLASRDVCVELGMNVVPVLFNTFGDEAWKILGSLCSECKLVLKEGLRSEASGPHSQPQQVPGGWTFGSPLPRPQEVALAGNTAPGPKNNVVLLWDEPSRPMPGHRVGVASRRRGRANPVESWFGSFGPDEGNKRPATWGSANDDTDQGRPRLLELDQGINVAPITSTPPTQIGPKTHKRGVSWGSVSTLCDAGYQEADLHHAAPNTPKLAEGDEVPFSVAGKEGGDVNPALAQDLTASSGVREMDEKKDISSDSRPYSLTFENAYGRRVVSYGGAFNSSRSSRTIIGYNDGRPDSTVGVPEKVYPQPYRGLRHRLFIVYRRLFSFVFLSNIAALIAIALFPQVNRDWTGTVSVMNLTVAVLVRQDRVVNALYAIFCSVPKSWPVWIRWQSAKIYHLGGVHSGAATAAVVWFIASVVYSIKRRAKASNPVRTETLVMSWTAITLLIAMLIAAYPTLRKRYHNRFELVHRFAGWTALAIFWAQSIYSINGMRDQHTQTLGAACLRSSNFWLLLVVSLSILSPWLHLRKVDVRAEVLSDHAVRLHFDYVTPVAGSFTRMSERPLIEWHSFAVIPLLKPTPKQQKGYSVIVSNAGDWTKRQIQRPPTKLWIRGLPTCGVMHIARLFNRVVLIGTGSGIGPLLSFLQARPAPVRLIWSTPDPIETFGEEICKDVVAADPDCIIHDTKLLGRPDLVRMAYQAAVEFEAEAVIIIANEKVTKKVVYGLETRGLAAYGAIWDS